MTIIEFVEKYKNANSDKVKEQMLRARIKRTYCPILEKRVVLQTMLDNSVSVTDTGVKYIDMTTSRINYTMALIALYTDLKVDRDDNDKGLINEDYDALIESGIIGEICEIIGEKEISEFSSINADIMRNFESSEASIQATFIRFMSDLVDKVGIATGFAIDSIDKILGDNYGE